MKTKSNFKWLIDAGHGGMKNGIYTTAPAKMFNHGDFIIYEGVINRAVATKLHTMLEDRGIEFALVYDEYEDTSLGNRVEIANRLYAKDSRCIYLSIHSNAGGGKGIEVFTSIGSTRSDKIANYFIEQYKIEFPHDKLRADTGDGDEDKEANFKVISATNCPAVLVESFFFDNRGEALFLLSEEGQSRIAKVLFKAIVNMENNLKF